jgi:site-specific recombinase XerD
LTAPLRCTSAGPRTASRRRIRFAATSYALSASCSATGGGYVFETERGTPFTTDAVNRLIKRIGERAGFSFKVHVHMLRHACGYALANAGHDTRAIQDWLGHRAIQHTARYTELSQERFKDFWRT